MKEQLPEREAKASWLPSGDKQPKAGRSHLHLGKSRAKHHDWQLSSASDWAENLQEPAGRSKPRLPAIPSLVFVSKVNTVTHRRRHLRSPRQVRWGCGRWAPESRSRDLWLPVSLNNLQVPSFWQASYSPHHRTAHLDIIHQPAWRSALLNKRHAGAFIWMVKSNLKSHIPA